MHELPHDQFEQRIIAWGRAREDVCALLITSTRAIPGGVTDALSDYDIILVVDDITPYHASRDWLAAFGTVLALFRDPITKEFGSPSSGYVIQFEEHLKIDFTLWTPAALRHIAALPILPDELDAGYRVLLDKDGLTDNLAAPTYKAYIPQKPNGQPRRCLDVTRAKEWFGFEAQMPFDEGLRKTVEWYRNEGQ
jgi:aminoglycoside 6-adenylyltransferase